MEIVSQNSEADLARARAAAIVEGTVRELAANLIRVVRGAGKPYEIGQQAQSLVDAIFQYHEVAGQFPASYDLANALRIRHDPWDGSRYDQETQAQIHAEEMIIDGALQIAASRLLGQRTQESAGDREMHDGIRALEEIQEERRRKWQTSNAPPRKKRSPTKRSAKPKI